MAYTDTGALMPTEALYSQPGAYSGVLKGEALKRASYLSEMDKFYEGLKVSSEQFEKQYSLAEREMGFAEEQAMWEREFTEEQAEKSQDIESERLAHEKAIAKMGVSAQVETSRWQYDLGMEELDFRREVEEKKLPESEEWDIASKFLTSMI